jgi:2,3-bisphosphoglycerate-independent phosphoglycerate mutase
MPPHALQGEVRAGVRLFRRDAGRARHRQAHGLGVEAPTGIPPAEQYEAWARLALEAIEGYDGLYIHIKGPDVPAHDGDHDAKIASIEDIDRIFFTGLLSDLDLSTAIVAVTADHSTSCARKAHADGPVPLVVCGGTVSSDAVESYGETASRRGR